MPKKEIIMSSAQKRKQADEIWERLSRGEPVSFEERRAYMTGTTRYKQLHTLDMLTDIQSRMKKIGK